MGLIDGIGGAFLYSNDPAALVAWYRDVLGLFGPDASTDYRQFEYHLVGDPSRVRSTTWAILPAALDIRGVPRTGQINYRVTDMVAMIAQLQSRGVIIDEVQTHSYGKFAWLLDSEGNRVELFEEL